MGQATFIMWFKNTNNLVMIFSS